MVFDPEKFFFDSTPSGGQCSASFESVNCYTCKCEIKSEDWSSHWNEETHACRTVALSKVSATELMLHKRRKEAVGWKARVSSLNRAHWRSELYRKMVEYVTDCTVESTAVTVPLEKYELMERVDLLDLAVWKATCFLSPPQNVTFRNVVDCQAWMCSGWKVLKEEMRGSNAITIIHAQVLPWLDQV
jgi:hypothetical protein